MIKMKLLDTKHVLWHKVFHKDLRLCDAPKPGGPLTTRQPAEIYESHVMRPIHVQKWPLGPTHQAHKMYILYKMIHLQLYLITIYTKMGLLPIISTKYKVRPSWPFLLL